METERFINEILPLKDDVLRYSGKFLSDGSDKEDVAQEVFLKLWSIKNKLDSHSNVAALAVKITKNLCLNRIRDLRHTAKLDTDKLSDWSIEGPQRDYEHKDSFSHVLNLMDELPDLQRMILKMKHVEELEVEEIAAITGGTAESIRMNLSRARKKIKERLLKI